MYYVEHASDGKGDWRRLPGRHLQFWDAYDAAWKERNVKRQLRVVDEKGEVRVWINEGCITMPVPTPS